MISLKTEHDVDSCSAIKHLLLLPGFITFDDNEDSHLDEIRHFKFSNAQFNVHQNCTCGLLLQIFQIHICSCFRIISSAFAINQHP